MTGIMAPLASARDKVMFKLNTYAPRAIHLAMAMSSSSLPRLTIGEYNQKFKVVRASEWIFFISIPSALTAITVALAVDMYKGIGFVWWLPIVILTSMYQAVVVLAMGHLGLFLPRAPLATREVLKDVGLKLIGLLIILVGGIIVSLFDQVAWVLITWACLLATLIATVVAYWVCLVQTYGE